MGKVIYIERRPRLMECTECNCDEFCLCSDGTIRCWSCGGTIAATWVRSSSPPKDGGGADAA